MTTKTCTKCGQEKGVANFRRRSDGPALGSWCLDCERLRCRTYMRSPRGKQVNRRAKLKYLFGLTAEQHDAILDAQGGGCAVCGHTCPTGKRLAVDHDHVTGQVRGLLCVNCNKGIGHLRDSHVLLAKAAGYLTRPPAYEILQPLDVSTTGE